MLFGCSMGLWEEHPEATTFRKDRLCLRVLESQLSHFLADSLPADGQPAMG